MGMGIRFWNENKYLMTLLDQDEHADSHMRAPSSSTANREEDRIGVLPPRKRSRSEPFDPFSEFVFRAVKKEQQHHNPIDSYFSSYQCVASGVAESKGIFGQSEQTSWELENRRPNFVNRQCHYRNLYYNIKDRTFHYLASPAESKMLQEARMADAKIAIESGSKRKPSEFLLADQKLMQQQHTSDKIPVRNDVQNYVEGFEAYDSHPNQFTSYAELLNRMTIQIAHAEDTGPDYFNKKKVSKPWRPIVHEHNTTEDLWKTLPRVNDQNTTASFAIVDIKRSQDDTRTDSNDFYFALNHPYHSFNIGHLLWDDVLAFFSLYDRLIGSDSIPNKNGNDLIIPFFVELPNERARTNYNGSDQFWRCSPGNPVKWHNCVKMFRRVYTAFTGIATDKCSGDLVRTGSWLHGDKPIGEWNGHAKNDSCLDLDEEERQRHLNRNRLVDKDGVDINADYVMIPNVLAGAGRLGYFACNQDCSLGRSRESYRFRNYVYQNILAAESYDYDPESKTRAGYIVFSQSVYSSRPDLVSNFENEIKESIQLYGKDVVKVVDLAKMTMKDQVLLLDETAVLITNHGGISSATIFLPRGSAALIYWHKTKMDNQWNEAAGYFRPVFIGVEERPFLNRTMAIIDEQLRKTRVEWSAKKTP